jgi:hypothetical protein
MKSAIGICLIAMFLTGCAMTADKKTSYAQCQMNALGPEANKFRAEFQSYENDSKDKDREAEYHFVILCMESKGYMFENQYDDNAMLNKRCYFEQAEHLNHIPYAFELGCYHKIWW